MFTMVCKWDQIILIECCLMLQTYAWPTEHWEILWDWSVLEYTEIWTVPWSLSFVAPGHSGVLWLWKSHWKYLMCSSLRASWGCCLNRRSCMKPSYFLSSALPITMKTGWDLHGEREAKPSFLIFPCNNRVHPQRESGHRTATDTSVTLVLL